MQPSRARRTLCGAQAPQIRLRSLLALLPRCERSVGSQLLALRLLRRRLPLRQVPPRAAGRHARTFAPVARVRHALLELLYLQQRPSGRRHRNV